MRLLREILEEVRKLRRRKKRTYNDRDLTEEDDSKKEVVYVNN
jgi:hypothetical protein